MGCDAPAGWTALALPFPGLRAGDLAALSVPKYDKLGYPTVWRRR